MTDMNTIEDSAKAYAGARVKLTECVSELTQALDNLKRSNLPRIKRHLARVAQLEAELKALIAEAPHQFIKPKTVVLHGIKLGFEKGKGSITWDDPHQVVALVKRKLPDLADVLIKTDEKPLKGGLKQLTVQQLKSIGCAVEESGDMVIVRAVDSDVDKLVTALLKGAEVEEPEPA